ncbi:MotA/TolQ/ExbB proton channel family protein [Planctomyces sp. SH-PL62]|uniref:MotA/TolQ/ExbB proton channel family protein n=1 Tax=Planctomyces sp. SH-PL62 TaxID=1636152 RepID=UPI00078CD5B1|nr:MotA/TolQ/ExbB proton channel family protein [Planctomyces sp. SH-PL62]AMV37578.1 MotA/TolQ/ExbB proton channel family protein [Planctomyces sp. SH-PL62]
MIVGSRRGPAVATALIGIVLLAAPSAFGAEPPKPDLSVDIQRRMARTLGDVLVWYERTPAGERMAWGGLGACVALGVCVTLERAVRLRRRSVIPNDFLARFLDRLHEGRLDGGKALDYCEMHPSPAARVALAAVRRWGRPAVDLERAVGLAHRWESEQLRRNVGTLRRITAMAPLVGLLGSLLAADRLMRENGDATLAQALPALADALSPLISGVAVGVVAMVLYDMLTTRVERLGAALDRLGAETIDAVAMTTVVAAPTLASYPSTPHIRLGEPSVERRPIVSIPVRESAPRRLRDEPSLGA